MQVLDAYLIDNPQQHIHCMSPDNEYISLIMYAITIEVDLCNFLAIWAVLSILLDTQSNALQHVKSLQQCYIVGLGLNCKFIDLLFKRSFIKFIKISLYLNFIVLEIISKQTDTLN